MTIKERELQIKNLKNPITTKTDWKYLKKKLKRYLSTILLIILFISVGIPLAIQQGVLILLIYIPLSLMAIFLGFFISSPIMDDNGYMDDKDECGDADLEYVGYDAGYGYGNYKPRK